MGNRAVAPLFFLLALPALAQPTQQAAPPLQRASDEIARLETAHLKEMLKLVEEKNNQLRESESRANEQRFKAQEQAVAFALAASEKATTKADAANEKRFDGVNEFRSQLKDQAATFITRGELFGWIVAVLALAFTGWNTLRKSTRKQDQRDA